MDRHNIGIGSVLNVVVSQHLTMVLDVVLTLFPSKLGHPSKWVWELVEALQLLNRTFVLVCSVTSIFLRTLLKSVIITSHHSASCLCKGLWIFIESEKKIIDIVKAASFQGISHAKRRKSVA